MVIYDLQCNQSHTFETWFKDQGAFEKQKRFGLVQCPVCGTSQVRKVPSACHIKTGTPVLQESEAPKLQENTSPSKPDPVDPVVLIKTVQKYVQNHFKNVGKEFAEKAIQMHNGEIPKEPIHGTATKNDIEQLDSEGVVYVPLPKLDERFEN